MGRSVRHLALDKVRHALHGHLLGLSGQLPGLAFDGGLKFDARKRAVFGIGGKIFQTQLHHNPGIGRGLVPFGWRPSIGHDLFLFRRTRRDHPARAHAEGIDASAIDLLD